MEIRSNVGTRVETSYKQDRLKKCYCELEGIEESELECRKSANECLRCAWPSDRIGRHRVLDCVQTIKWNKRTANLRKVKQYQKMKIARLDIHSSESEDDSCNDEEPGYVSDDDNEISEDSRRQCLDHDDDDGQDNKEEDDDIQQDRNWWYSESS